MKLGFLLFSFLLLQPNNGLAQTGIPANSNVRICADDNQPVLTYRFYLDNKQIEELPVTQISNGTICSTPFVITAGSHSAGVSAVNQFGESTKALITVNVGNVPNPPTSPRITITTQATIQLSPDGTRLELVQNSVTAK